MSFNCASTACQGSTALCMHRQTTHVHSILSPFMRGNGAGRGELEWCQWGWCLHKSDTYLIKRTVYIHRSTDTIPRVNMRSNSWTKVLQNTFPFVWSDNGALRTEITPAKVVRVNVSRSDSRFLQLELRRLTQWFKTRCTYQHAL